MRGFTLLTGLGIALAWTGGFGWLSWRGTPGRQYAPHLGLREALNDPKGLRLMGASEFWRRVAIFLIRFGLAFAAVNAVLNAAL